jgi:hypothetical protein
MIKKYDYDLGNHGSLIERYSTQAISKAYLLQGYV